MSFVHLHVHSQYSFLDGASSLDRLLEKAADLGMPAMALTDHNRLTGAIRFYEKARALGIKPIIGAEIETEGGYHLTLLCKDRNGYISLCRLLTEAHLSNRGKPPAVTRQMLQKFSSGLIVLSGCRCGEIPVLLEQGNYEKAGETARFFREIFGEDFYVEIVCYPSCNGCFGSYRLVEFARENSLPFVATNNVHYAEMPEYEVKELLNAIGQNIPVSMLPGFRTVEQYLKSQEEMKKLFSDMPEAIDITETLAEKCNLDLGLGKLHFPKYDVSLGETDYGYLFRIADAGARRKYGELSSAICERLKKEMDTIRTLGFCGYFLVVWDIVRWAREHGIRCQARGSAVDSLVVYVLDISTVDPVEHDLLFERFMHPLRHEPPDIDLDIDRRRRDEVRDYVYQKYGNENVACVGTINTYMARGAIRDTGKALQMPQEFIDQALSGVRWHSMSSLLKHADDLPELKGNDIYKNSEFQRFFEICTAIDGFPKHLSVHLGGLLIGGGRLAELVPLEWSSGGDIISQYNKDDIEKIGLVKMDLLSLPTLTVIEDTLSNIKKNWGIDIGLDGIDKNDLAAFAMLQEGKSIGTFQLESPAQREMAGRLLPDRYEDIIVSISLVRPGPLKSNMDKDYLPRRHGKKPVTYLHPKLKDALGETLGIILYQEQVLKVAHDLAGMSYAEADGFRRAMTHDRTDEEMEKMRESFISSSVRRGVSKAIAEKVFEQLAAFAAYGFCKAHAAAYAELAYQTLWLKCHYPAEFFAAVLSNQPMGYYPPRVLVAEARRSGVEILLVDINHSDGDYTVEKAAIRISLRQLKGMSEEALKSILAARGKRPFISLRDFVLRTEVNQSIAENLIKVGAFAFCGNREALLQELSRFIELRRRVEENTRRLMEEEYPETIAITNGDSKLNIEVERELLSLNLSAHPLDNLFPNDGFTRMKDLRQAKAGQAVKIAGSVIRYQTPPTRNGNRVVYVIMEDGTGIADVTVFSDVQQQSGDVLLKESWLVVEGKVQKRGPKSLSIIADKIEPLRNHTIAVHSR
ncbi:DNA polymerase III subunit alpha [Chloroflexota bacterium]